MEGSREEREVAMASWLYMAAPPGSIYQDKTKETAGKRPGVALSVAHVKSLR